MTKTSQAENHGMSKTKAYFRWLGMKQRCYDPGRHDYKHYGGRGITVCNEWRESFTAYHEYVGEPTSPKHSLDRIDNNKGYEPGNVRWATQRQQLSNRRPVQSWSRSKLYTNNKSGYRGVTHHKAKDKWQARVSIGGVERHLGYFDSLELACQARELATSS